MNEITKIIKQDWSDNNVKRYNWIYNKLQSNYPGFNYDINDYILKINKPKLLTFIKKLDIGPGSREAMFFTVSKYLQLNDSKSPHIFKFQKEGHKLMDAAKKKDGDNLIDDDKIEAYESYDYFLKILKDIDYEKINNLKDHNQYL